MSIEKKHIEKLEKELTEKQKERDYLSIGRIFEILGHIKLGPFPPEEKISYWETKTIPFFEAADNFIRSVRSYQIIGSSELADTVARRAKFFLEEAVEKQAFDEDILHGLAHELIGDLLCLMGDGVNARASYEMARVNYDKNKAYDGEVEATWQVQEEFESVGAVIEDPVESAFSDMSLMNFFERLDFKINNCNSGK